MPLKNTPPPGPWAPRSEETWATSIKFAGRFSGSTIEFGKFAIALDGAAVEGRGTRWKGDPVLFFCFEPLIRRPPLSEINEK